MNTNLARILITAVLFIIIFVFGYVLTHLGKPYNTIILTIHKLVALGAVVYLGIIAYQLHKSAPFTAIQIALLVLTGVFLIGLFVTGALLSVDKSMPTFVKLIHHIAPYLMLASTAATYYLLMV